MTDATSLLKRTQERHFSAHNTLLHIAQLELEMTTPGNVGEFNHAFTAITFSALAIEALANAVGDRVIPEWKDFESANPYAKARLLAERLGVQYDKQQQPWPDIKWLCRFRNNIAHAKPELVVREEVIPTALIDEHRLDRPKSKLELEVTHENAQRAVKAAVDLKYLLTDRVDIGNRFGLPSDGWTTSTTLHK